MRRLVTTLVLVVGASSLYAQVGESTPEQEVRTVIQQFEQGLSDRNLSKIEELVAPEMVAFENGHRNEGWPDFRDNHLVPEMKEPPPPSKSEVVKVVAADKIGWGYTKTTMRLTRSGGQTVEALLWSIYVLEKRNATWKIVALDWSLRAPPPQAKP